MATQTDWEERVWCLLKILPSLTALGSSSGAACLGSLAQPNPVLTTQTHLSLKCFGGQRWRAHQTRSPHPLQENGSPAAALGAQEPHDGKRKRKASTLFQAGQQQAAHSAAVRQEEAAEGRAADSLSITPPAPALRSLQKHKRCHVSSSHRNNGILHGARPLQASRWRQVKTNTDSTPHPQAQRQTKVKRRLPQTDFLFHSSGSLEPGKQ